ncbi:Spo0E family sporulation regulatory protein-aspartic acid phosphatase [Alicyclobacillus dauci]
MNRGSLTHPDVVQLSQRLDVLILEIQRTRFESDMPRVLAS